MDSSNHPALRVLASTGYRRLVGGSALYSLGQWMEQLTVGWFILQSTGSVFLTAMAWAVRALPNLLFGSFGGAIADRYPRNRVLCVTAGIRALNVLAMGVLVLYGGGSVVVLLCLVAISGLGNTTQLAAAQSLAADNSSPADLPHAVSTLAFANRAVGAAGALSAGFVLAWLDAGWTLLLAALPLAGASALLVRVPAPATPRAGRSKGLWRDAIGGMRSLAGIPSVTRLLGLMAAAEVLGFSYNAFMPVIAERVLGLGAQGLGALVSAAALGSMTGVGLLAALPGSQRQGRLLLWVVFAFGLLVAVLPWSRVFALSLVIVALVGACAALIDTLQWSLLQRSVDASLRGRVLGAWNVAIGVGWLGPVCLGLLAEVAGVGVALGLAGVLLAAIGLLGFGSKWLRQAGDADSDG